MMCIRVECLGSYPTKAGAFGKYRTLHSSRPSQNLASCSPKPSQSLDSLGRNLVTFNVPLERRALSLSLERELEV